MRSSARHLRWLLLCATALLACNGDACEGGGDTGSSSEAEPAAGEPARPSPEADPPADVTQSRPMMGTVFRVTVTGTPASVAEPAVRRALDEIARLEDVLSEWQPDSEISRINEAAGDHPVDVGPETMAVVKAGMDVSRWSEGAFDLSWAALRGLYDFNANPPEIPGRREVRKRLPLIDWQDIEVDEEASTVFLKREGMAIGTGGIAKGYALDRAGEILRDAGIESYMLFGGGQVQVYGKRGNRPWRVGIQHPREPSSYFGFVEATDGSISTSGDYEHAFFDAEGVRWHHILDPRTGMPARNALSVTVRAATGLYADALSTAAFVMGSEQALEMFREIPYRAEMIMVSDECRVVTTPQTRERLKLTGPLGEDHHLPGCSP